MGTKVKGGAIKEGSIPLSALSDEVKDKIENAGGGATPDWNAQKEETGYIENKPCKQARIFKFNTEYDYKDDTAFYIDISYLGELWIDGKDEFGAIRVENDYSSIPYIYTFYKDFNNSNVRYHLDAYYADVEIVNKDIYDWGNITCLKVKTTSEDTFKQIINLMEFNEEYDYEKKYTNPKDLFFIPLDESFIPDKVIKTTPQTLSDTDKNQALANLGIDPVVWKYMCNPHIVEFDRANYEFNNAIPKELSDIIYQNHKFNHLILSTVLIKIYKESEEGSSVFWRVERITSYDEFGNVIFDGEEFGYEPNTRLFVV